MVSSAYPCVLDPLPPNTAVITVTAKEDGATS
jgi:hypothetical protein